MKEREAVVDAAIADGRKAGLTNSTELANHVFENTGFLKKRHSRDVGAALRVYVTAQCAEEDCSTKELPWWHEITSLPKAKKAQLVFVEVDDEGKAKTAWSCQKKQVYYPAGSGLTHSRGSIGYSVEKLGGWAATQFALRVAVGARLLRKFEKQVKKLRSSAQKPKLDALLQETSRPASPTPARQRPRGRRRCGETSPSARRRAAPSRHQGRHETNIATGVRAWTSAA